MVALHGWGANAEDLASLAAYLQLPSYQLLFPNAPLPHPHAPNGRAWYALV
ncbi:MAG: alpha/beta hydrolase, partial [Spirulinaceae cyanobacterium RM2_2_10]|nr:alpha/beta hydrolase [Spirulinaceae cyanobacterium RM2_2_10]